MLACQPTMKFFATTRVRLANKAALSQIQQRASCMIYGITLAHTWTYLGT